MSGPSTLPALAPLKHSPAHRPTHPASLHYLCAVTPLTASLASYSRRPMKVTSYLRWRSGGIGQDLCSLLRGIQQGTAGGVGAEMMLRQPLQKNLHPLPNFHPSSMPHVKNEWKRT